MYVIFVELISVTNDCFEVLVLSMGGNIEVRNYTLVLCPGALRAVNRGHEFEYLNQIIQIKFLPTHIHTQKSTAYFLVLLVSEPSRIICFRGQANRHANSITQTLYAYLVSPKHHRQLKPLLNTRQAQRHISPYSKLVCQPRGM